MALDVKQGTLTAPASAGQQTVTVGFEPKVVFFWYTEKTAFNSFTANCHIGYGWATGTAAKAQYAVGVSADDGLTKNTSKSRIQDDACVLQIADAGAVTLEANLFESFSTTGTGFKLDWVTTISGVNIHYMALGGTNLTNVKSGDITFGAAPTGNKLFSGIGFKPEYVQFLSDGKATGFPGSAGKSISIGHAVSATARSSISMLFKADSGGSNKAGGHQKTDRCFTSSKGPVSVEMDADFVAMDADGFTLNLTTAKNNVVVPYLALEGIDLAIAVGSATQKTTPTGTKSTTGLGFKPNSILVYSANNVATAGGIVDSKQSIGASDGANESSLWAGNEDSPSGSTNADDYDSDAKVLVLATPSTPTKNAEANMLSFDNDGFTLDWTTTDATAREFLYVAFGEIQHGRPSADTARGAWKDDAGGITNIYLEINESAPPVDTGSYIKNAEGFGNTYKTAITSVVDPLSSDHHKVRFRIQKTGGGSVTTRIELHDASKGTTLIKNFGTETALTGWSTKEYTLSGPEADSISDYGQLEFWIFAVSIPLFNELRVSWAEFECTAGSAVPPDHPAPTSLEIDRVATPNNTASDNALFSCIAQTNGTETIDSMQIQVSDDNTFAATDWDSGFQTITNVTDGNRTDEVAYAGTTLSEHPTDDKYYVRIKLRDSASVESAWSATAEFKVTKLGWDWAEANMRHVLHWVEDHPALPVGYVQKFQFQTGNRERVASNGHFNESIQGSGFQIAYFGNRTHVVYLGVGDDISGNLTVWINSFDWITETWGTPRKISDVNTSLDSHFAPVIAIDGSGYLHIPYGAHGGPFRYTRSRLSNDAGTLPGDTSTDVFIKPSQLPTVAAGYETITGFSGTYPFPFYAPTASRMFFFFRVGQETGEHGFIYSDDEGKTWSGVHTIIDDTVDPFRAYLFGLVYDEVNQRLHIAFTFNQTGDIERGVWYAYSDYDVTDGSSMTTAGFNIFKWADGSHAGYTSDDGTKTEIDYVTGKAIELSTDQESRIFIEKLELDKNNKPVIFWDQRPENGSAIEETDLVCATYSADIGSAGSWNKHYISEQVDLKQRVRRSSVGVMTDRDGIMRMWYPVNAKTFTHFLPTSDVDGVGDTRSSGVDNFAMVDDGITAMDGSTYVELAAGTANKFSCDSSKTINTDYQVLEVEVHAVVQSVTSAGNFQIYIDDGTTEDKATSAAATAGDWTYEKAVWAINPFTTAAWANSEINALEFGVYNANASVVLRVARLFMRVKYTLAGDDEMFATEIWELQSTDDGATWTVKKEVTRNSAFGIPILNNKHRLTNDTIEVVWCAGNDIFYQRDTPYGLILPTGQDVRLYYDGTEIDRLIDYPNLNTTTISFKIQAVVPLDRRAGPAPYVLYFAAPNTTTNAKGDPQLVYSEYFESFETYATGTNMDGTGGWTAGLGTWEIGTSPGDTHGNKIYAGNNAINQSNFTPFTNNSISRNITANYTDALIEIALWDEIVPKWAEIEVEDGAGKKYTVRVQPSGVGLSHLKTAIDGVLVSTGFRGEGQVYYDLAIQITASGASAFRDGLVVAREEPAVLVDVDKLSLKSESESFFDFIRVSKSVAVGIVQLVDPPTPRAEFAHDTTNSDTEDVTFDGLFESAGVYNRTHAVEVRIGLQSNTAGPYTGTVTVRVCGGTTWDSTNVLAFFDIAFTNIDTTMEFQTHKFTFTDFKVEGPVSVKVDYHTTTDPNPVASTTLWDWVKVTDMAATPTIVLQTREVQGWYTDCTLSGAGEDFWNMDAFVGQSKIAVASAALIEWKGSVRDVVRGAPVSFMRGVGFLRGAAIGWIGSLRDALRGVVIEFASAASFRRGALAAWAGSVKILRGAPVAFKRGVGFLRGFTVGWIGSLRDALRGAAVEFGAAFSFRRGTTVGWIGSARDVIRGLPVEFKRGIGLLRGIQAEWGRSVVSILRGLRASWVGSLKVIRGTPVAWVGSLRNAIRGAQVSFKRAASYPRGFPVAWKVNVAAILRGAVVDFARRFSQARGVLVEFRGSVKLLRGAVASWKGSAKILRGAVVGVSRKISSGLRGAEVAWKVSVSYLRGAPVAWVGSLRNAIRGIPVGWIGSIKNVLRSITTEWGRSVESVDRDAVVGFDLGISGERGAEAEWKGASKLRRGVPTEFGTGFSEKRGAEIEFGQRAGIVRAAQVSFDLGLKFEAGAEVEWAGSASLSASLGAPVEWKTAVKLARAFEAEFSGGFSRARGVAVETSQGLAIQRSALVEYKQSAAYLRGLEAAWGRVIPAILRGAEAEFGVGLSESRGAPVSFSQKFSGLRGAEVDWNGTVNVSLATGIPIEWKTAQKIIRGNAVEFGTGFLTTRGIDVETSYRLALKRGAEIEFGVGSVILAFSAGIPVEWTTGRAIERGFEVDFSTGLSVPRSAPVDWKSGRSIVLSTEVEWGRLITAQLGLEVETALKALLKLGFPVEWAGTVFGAILIINEEIVLAHHINEAVHTATLASEEIGIATHASEGISSPRHANEDIEVPDYDNMRQTGA